MSRTRVLIIDDSVVVRRFLSDLLASEPDMELAGIAPNGRIGLAKVSQTSPDLVLLDLEMPEMDGLETLREIRRQQPLLPVIMYSSLTQRGARATLDALEMGANDYVTKPSQMGSPEEAVQCVRADLIPKIRALARRTPRTSPAAGPPALMGDVRSSYRPSSPVTRGAQHHPVEILAIGTSTGGPNALAEMLPTLPADFPVPIVIVQHMPPLFTKMLAERLTTKSAITVGEAVHGERLKPGHAWIAPGDYHMIVTRSGGESRVALHQGPHENSCRPSVDVLFRSVATAYGAGTLALVLTGMGSDGLRGCEQVRESGGSIMVQDEVSSVVWGMPGFVARAGLADRVLCLKDLGPALLGRVRHEQTVGRSV